MVRSIHIAGYAEDPGAANFFVGLHESLAELDAKLSLYASEPALSYLKSKSEEVKELPNLDQVVQNVDLLCVGTSQNNSSPAFSLIEHAKQQKIPTIGIVDAPISFTQRFAGKTDWPLEYLPDHVVVAQEKARDGMISMGVARSQITMVRHPYYDRVEQHRCDLERKNFLKNRIALFGARAAKKKIVIFLCESSKTIHGGNNLNRTFDYTLLGNPKSNKRTEVVLDEVISALDEHRDDVFLVAKLHPKENISEYSKYAEVVDIFSSDEDPLDLVFFADYVIGMTSSLLVESALIGKPVLSVTPKEEEYVWLPQEVAPQIPSVWTKSDLELALRELFAGKMNFHYERVDIGRVTFSQYLTSLRQR